MISRSKLLVISDWGPGIEVDESDFEWTGNSATAWTPDLAFIDVGDDYIAVKAPDGRFSSVKAFDAFLRSAHRR